MCRGYEPDVDPKDKTKKAEDVSARLYPIE
jgi:hypothetical protein